MELRITSIFLIAGVFTAIFHGTDVRTAEAQLLSQAREEVRSATPPSNSDRNEERECRKRNRRSRDDDDDDNNIIGDLFTGLLFGNGNSESRQSASDGGGNDIDYEIYASSESVNTFVSFPYQDGLVGGVLVGSPEGNPNRIQTAVWYGSDFDNIDTWNSQIRFDNSGPIGLDFQYSHLTEKLSGLPRDSLNLADINFTYRWIETPQLIARIGGGVNFFWDRHGTEADLNFTMSADLFPVQPLIASLEFDYGEVGAVHQTHLLSTIGVNYGSLELMTGYEYRRIGRVDIDGVLFGCRLWW